MPHNITARELIEFYANGIRKFRNADLRGADLRQVNLSEADLQGSYLRWAELQGAMLDNANLTWADLQRANLSDASLNKAMLSEARTQVGRAVPADARNSQRSKRQGKTATAARSNSRICTKAF